MRLNFESSADGLFGLAHVGRNLLDVLLVFGRDEHVGDTAAVRGQQLLLQTGQFLRHAFLRIAVTVVIRKVHNRIKAGENLDDVVCPTVI